MRGNKKKNVMPIFFCGGPKKKTKKGQVLTKNEYKNKVRGYDENLIFRTHSVVNVATRPHVRWLTQLNGRAVHIYLTRRKTKSPWGPLWPHGLAGSYSVD